MNRRLALLIGFALAAILTFGGLLYYALRTKVTDVSSFEPYSEIVGTTVVLKRPAVIVRNLDAFVNEHPYLLIEIDQGLFEGTEAIDTLPIGTSLEIQKAKHFTNGSSGFAHAFVLGWVELPGSGKIVPFEYGWGEQHISLYDEEVEYWTYPMALWQENANARKFYVKHSNLQ
ncbi:MULTISPECIES: hypothetical protein [unclassified Imperialibacter]|uniref:hypothetical protein n=1 Tax=unclassified Imperialibacter TaxID=2629706 RepID=UPI0012520B55|nr:MULTISPECIES: hypothetical protein [unclassified Imperialibacter]CAD5279334.1 conserved hypothetical protein [Imperialibacter sp. 75]CAD5288913.1 conserved hypothetical protein [Imperialibacter sp. 89]VVT16286.1 conserved hypothetical protein [Imperialibacter sp. EC-SDR9]